MLYNLSFNHDLPDNSIVIDVTSNSPSFGRQLSPFYVGPCELYDGYTAYNVENAYQFASIFPAFADEHGEPLPTYWPWAIKGWQTKRPIKFPLGPWNKRLHHWWDGRKLNRLEAQNEIFVPLYKKAVVKTKAFQKLKSIYEQTDKDLILLDYEGFDHRFLDLDWNDVLNHPDFPIGQGFILCMLLEGFLKPED